jgi:hypothetical protein
MNFGKVEWDWYTKEDALYWHWSQLWLGNEFKLEGYNECLITYVMAVSSPTHPIAAAASQGWARNGAIVSGASQYGIPVILIIMELRKCRTHVLVALFLFRSGSFHFKRSIC